MHVYALLALDEEGMESPVNANVGSDQAVDIYLGCASVLSRSLLRHANLRLNLLTNNSGFLERRMEQLGLPPIQIQSIPMTRVGPEGSTFRLAMHKLDVLEFLSKKTADEVFILLDTDIVLARKLPTWFGKVLNEVDLGLYEITNQVVPRYGRDVIQKDLSLVSGSLAPTRWYGGEVLCGSSDSLRRLMPYIDSCFSRYKEHWRDLHHNGDEIVISASIGLMTQNESISSVDLGLLGLVSRFWSILPSRTRQLKTSVALSAPLLHLPADKVYLSSLALSKNHRYARRDFSVIRYRVFRFNSFSCGLRRLRRHFFDRLSVS